MSSYILRRIDPDLWQRVKVKAVKEQITVREVIERLLKDWIKK